MSNPILVFAGSTRLASINRKLAHVAAQMARDAGARVTHLELAELDIPLYNADLEARGTPADVIRLKQILFEHPGWIICSPEYNGSYTALLKNTIDWASSPVKGHPDWSAGLRAFAGKVVGMLSTSGGARGGLRSLDHLSPLLQNSGCWVTPKRHSVASAAEAFAADGSLTNPRDVEGVSGVVQQVVWGTERLAS